MTKPIYLDHAAATPIDPAVLKIMQSFLEREFYNPSATYLAGRQARKELEKIRHKTAVIIGAKPSEVIFTAGATEANNLAVQGVMKQYPDGETLVSGIEHASVLEPARLFKTSEIPVDGQGLILLNKLSDLINDRTVLVSIMLVNNELGVIQPVREAANLINQFRQQRFQKGNKLPLYLHTDAAQAGNYLDLHASGLGVDLMSLNGGKIYGPKQAGVLYVKAGTRLQPLIVGGGQEFGLRSGTENLAGAAGLSLALHTAQQDRVEESKRVVELRRFFEGLIKEKLPSAIINGSPKQRAPHILSLTFPGQDNERLMMQLDEAGIQCAVGSACSAARQEASHVLSAIGMRNGMARATLRFSLGRYTAKADIERTVAELADLTASNR